MKSIRLLTALILVFCLAGPAAAGDAFAPSSPDEMYGVWEGKGRQDNGDAWSIRISLELGVYEVEYPSLSCRGVLQVLEMTPTYLRARERITAGQENCVDGGLLVLVRRQPGVLDYFWYYPDGRRGAVGDLRSVR